MREFGSYSINSGQFGYTNNVYPAYSAQYRASIPFKSNAWNNFSRTDYGINRQNRPENDYFEGSKKNNRKKLTLIFGAIAASAALLVIGLNLDKVKNFFNDTIQNAPKQAKKLIPAKKSAPKTPKKTPKNAQNASVTSPISTSNQQKAAKTGASRQNNSPKINNSIFHRKHNWSKATAGAVFTPNAASIQDYENILAITKKGNLESRDLKEIERIFKQHTGITLHCPESYNFKEFEGFFEPLIKYDMHNRISPEIKHIVIGHGTGSAAQGNWQFEGNKKSVFDFIESCIPKGEKALLVTCESTNPIKPGLGGPVNISLHAKDRPGKVVESGIRKIIGSAYLLGPNVIRYF